MDDKECVKCGVVILDPVLADAEDERCIGCGDDAHQCEVCPAWATTGKALHPDGEDPFWFYACAAHVRYIDGWISDLESERNSDAIASDRLEDDYR